MPPWKPEPGYGNFEGVRRLSDAEIETIQRWVADVRTKATMHRSHRRPHGRPDGGSVNPISSSRCRGPSRCPRPRTNQLDTTSPNNSRVYNGVDVLFRGRLHNGLNFTAGSFAGRLITKTCDVSNPNSLLYCDQGLYGIPFLTTYKLSGTYPLPWARGVYPAQGRPLTILPGRLLRLSVSFDF